jgi:sugar phosphate permease
VLSIRTNRWLIGASALGYFFFAGVRTFGLVFVRGHLALSQPSATAVLSLAGLGSLAGVLIAGRLADGLIRRGTLNARVLVGAISFLAAAALLVPAMLVSSVGATIVVLFIAGAMLSAPNPPLDAARLDIVPAQLWGRTQAVRTLLRQTAQTAAPRSSLACWQTPLAAASRQDRE